eukprot:11420368-Prorocentrum_lima.AAC.1
MSRSTSPPRGTSSGDECTRIAIRVHRRSTYPLAAVVSVRLGERVRRSSHRYQGTPQAAAYPVKRGRFAGSRQVCWARS